MSDRSEKFLQALLDLDCSTLQRLQILIEDVIDYKLSQMEGINDHYDDISDN